MKLRPSEAVSRPSEAVSRPSCKLYLYQDQVKLYRDQVKLYRDQVKLYRDLVKLYRDQVKLYRDQVKLYRDQVKLYRDQVKLYRDQVKLYRDQVKLYREVKLYRDQVKLYRDQVKLYRDQVKLYRDQVKLYRDQVKLGQFAVVYHCQHRVTGEEYAAKFSSRLRLGADCTSDILHEVAVCAMLRPAHRTIQLRDVFSTESELVLVMEYAAGGDLQTLLDQDMVPYERDVISFTRQLLEGLVFIHDRNLVHLDIKPQNLVLMGEFPDCAVKLCDFEISRVLTPGREVREILGTPDYVAPEILLYEPITKKTDMWSLGVLTYVLLTGFLPFGGDTDQETFLEISRGELDFPEELFEDISAEAIDFIKRLLVRQPERRMSVRECLDHPWMKKEMDRPTRPTTLPITPVSTPAPPITPTPITPGSIMAPSEITSPTMDIGLPPFHPNTPIKQAPPFPDPSSTVTSPVTFMPPVAPSSLQRQESRTASRPNLDRLRSMSKSREVLSERIQMSNLKKTISKSRERLFDAKLGLSKSHERLMGLRSFSQSVEALSALSQLSQVNSRYQSCNNIFVPMLTPSDDKDNDITCRMYKSLAAIDQIDGIDYSRKLGYFESRFSKDDEDYNDLVTRHNTNMNSVITSQDAPKTGRCGDMANEARLRGGGRGGRGGDICDKRCPRHNHRQSEAQLTQKIPKVNRAERMKREAQRRRKERKEREKEEREKQKGNLVSDPEVVSRTTNRTTQEKTTEGASSPSGRRRSVSHVEQRLAERHERQQERLEKQEKGERRNSLSNRRRSSVDLDRSPVSERLRLGKNNNSAGSSLERPRSTTPTGKHKTKKHSSGGSDVSQASSLESVDGNLDSPRTPTRPKRPTSLDLPEIKIFTDNTKAVPPSGDVNDNIVKQETRGDIDEAYVSLDDTSIYNRSRIMESNVSSESGSTITESKQEQQTQVISEPTVDKKDEDESENRNLQTASEQGLGGSGDLTIIDEEDDGHGKRKCLPSYVRSISANSDIGSMVSEGSEGSLDRDNCGSCSPSTDTDLSPEWKGRGRSMSIQSGGSTGSLQHKGRSRSNSVHLEPTGNNRARPWGGVCDGAVARALGKFNIRSDDKTPVGKPIPCRRMSTPPLSPSAEDDSAFLE
ncbi:citron rho-interacting kinase-like [Homarus americanus]|uniref:citron rho-interacting kinase-like n=1 Tax=Homarus americanus TaxID=6706 RepID=UPI001C468317|nr:citron rho-interacting kinase-like [Homarus americanus]